MPAFAEDADDPDQNLLTEEQITLIARWLRGDDRSRPSVADQPATTAATQ
jgi:hypothetical protein